MVFAREITDSLTSLVKKIDTATAKNSACNMGSFVVLMSDDENAEKKLKELAAKDNLKHTVLTLDNPSGPRGWNIARDADVTVILYKGKKVEANFAFKKGQLKPQAINQIVADVSKITPQK